MLAVVLGIVWGIMIVVIGVSVFRIFNYDRSMYYSDPTYHSDEILMKNYGAIYSSMNSLLSSGNDLKGHSEYDELIALHDYVESCAYFRMYTENGETEKALKYYTAMEEAKSRMGDLDFTASEIDDLIYR